MIFQAIQEKDFVNLINEIFWSQIFDQDFQCSSAEKSDLTQILEVFPATNPGGKIPKCSLKRQLEKDLEIGAPVHARGLVPWDICTCG